MHTIAIDALSVAIGIIIGYAFRGWEHKKIATLANNAITLATTVQTKMTYFEQEIRTKFKL